MKKRRVSTQIFLYFLMMMFLFLTVGCSSKDNPPAPTTYSITGTVSGPAQTLGTVVITLTNVSTAATATATTATDGTYSFTGLANGTYTLVPVLATYVFNPNPTVVVVNGSNMVQNFVSATTPGGTLYSISGYVYLDGTTTPLSGVTVTLGGSHDASVITGTDGTWSFAGLPGGAGNNYTVTAYLSGYSLTPLVYAWNAPSAISPGNIFYATVAAFSQADLAGTWVVHALKADGGGKWYYFTATVDVDGNVTPSSCNDSTSNTTCPSGTLKWTINSTTGVITEGGTLADTSVHMTMASNKTFIAGTSSGGGSNSVMKIALKEGGVGSGYKNADLQSQSFVFHQLYVGGELSWYYGAGSTDSGGVITISSQNCSSGSSCGSTGVTSMTMTVDSNGFVTNSGDSSWQHGFLSADKRTIVAVLTDTSTYGLMFIQVTTGQSSAVSQVAGTSYGHMLDSGTSPYWKYLTMSITSGGAVTFPGGWDTNGTESIPTGTATMSIGLSGNATITPPSGTSDFNGQLSYDGTFMVATETDGSYAQLDVITH